MSDLRWSGSTWSGSTSAARSAFRTSTAYRFSQLSVGEIVIDGPKPVAKLARRPGPLDAGAIERVWVHLGRSFPPA
jgi:hypothetical protein